MQKKSINENFGLGELPSSKLMKMSMKMSDIMKSDQDQHYVPAQVSNANHAPEPAGIIVDPTTANDSSCDTPADPRQTIIDAIRQDLDEKIKQEGDKWVVYNSAGDKALGTHPSKKEALKQLAAIEMNKSKNESTNPTTKISLKQLVNGILKPKK